MSSTTALLFVKQRPCSLCRREIDYLCRDDLATFLYWLLGPFGTASNLWCPAFCGVVVIGTEVMLKIWTTGGAGALSSHRDPSFPQLLWADQCVRVGRLSQVEGMKTGSKQKPWVVYVFFYPSKKAFFLGFVLHVLLVTLPGKLSFPTNMDGKWPLPFCKALSKFIEKG